MRGAIKKCALAGVAIAAVYIELFTFWNYYLDDNTFAKENMLSVFLLIGLLYLYCRFIRVKDKTALICGAITGALFGLIMVIGNKLYLGSLEEIFVSLRSVIKYMVLLAGEILFGIQIFTLFYHFILTCELPESEYKLYEGKKKKYRVWIGMWLLMFLCHMPCYLSNFPGIMSYDSGWITRQALGIIPFDNFHPFLHTLIWTACIRLEQLLGIPQFGLVIYSLGQALIVTAMFTYIVYFMVQRKVNKIFVIVTWLFYAFCPNIVLFSLITTKDILLGVSVAGVVMLLLHIWEGIEGGEEKQKSKRTMIAFAVVGTFSCLLRNNMIYAMIAAGIIMILVCKSHRSFFCG
ncbi:MAG: DUF6020 family protein [Eubacteriales bacterium]|nr:DUF6020 family protein [Eubacteriales bacterium]